MSTVKTTPAQRDEILILHADGHGGRKIAELTGISYGRVRGVLEREAKNRGDNVSSPRPTTGAGKSGTSAGNPTTPGPAVRVAVWDIETTDLKSDIGILVVSSFYYPDTDTCVTRTFKDFPDGEKGLAVWTLEQIESLDFIIGHNVKAFDRNFLSGVLARHGLGVMPRRGWWDTLYIARYGLKGQLQSNSMGNLADVLGLDGDKYRPSKHDWREVLVNPTALEDITRRCEEDVKLNYLLFQRLKPYFHRWTHRHE